MMMNLKDIADLMLKKAFPDHNLKSVETIDKIIRKLENGEVVGMTILEQDSLLSSMYDLREEIIDDKKDD